MISVARGLLCCVILFSASAASAQENQAKLRCAVQYAVATDLIRIVQAGKDKRYAPVALPSGVSEKAMHQRMSTIEKSLIDPKSSMVTQNAVSIDIMDRAETIVAGIAQNAATARTVFRIVRECDQAHKFSPVTAELPPEPSKATAAPTAEPRGWGRPETLNCAIQYYAMANLTRRQDLLQKTNEAMRRYAMPQRLAAEGVMATVKEKAAGRIKAPAAEILASIKKCDADLGFPLTAL